jgi:hypothetical protein
VSTPRTQKLKRSQRAAGTRTKSLKEPLCSRRARNVKAVAAMMPAAAAPQMGPGTHAMPAGQPAPLQLDQLVPTP